MNQEISVIRFDYDCKNGTPTSLKEVGLSKCFARYSDTILGISTVKLTSHRGSSCKTEKTDH